MIGDLKVISPSFCRAASTVRCCWPTRPRDGARRSRSTSAPGSRGKKRSARMIERLLASPAFAGHGRAARDACSSTCATCILPSHWAVRGEPPAFDTPDEDVYLDGRNIILLSKASIYMARHGSRALLIGPLAGNPFPDATPDFSRRWRARFARASAHRLTIEAPFSPAQDGRDQARRRARRAARADALVHAAV